MRRYPTATATATTWGEEMGGQANFILGGVGDDIITIAAAGTVSEAFVSAGSSAEGCR